MAVLAAAVLGKDGGFWGLVYDSIFPLLCLCFSFPSEDETVTHVWFCGIEADRIIDPECIGVVLLFEST